MNNYKLEHHYMKREWKYCLEPLQNIVSLVSTRLQSLSQAGVVVTPELRRFVGGFGVDLLHPFELGLSVILHLFFEGKEEVKDRHARASKTCEWGKGMLSAGVAVAQTLVVVPTLELKTQVTSDIKSVSGFFKHCIGELETLDYEKLWRARTMFNDAVLLRKQKQVDKAVQTTTRCLQLYSDSSLKDSPYRYIFYHFLALCHADLGRFDLAVSVSDLVVELAQQVGESADVLDRYRQQRAKWLAAARKAAPPGSAKEEKSAPLAPKDAPVPPEEKVRLYKAPFTGRMLPEPPHYTEKPGGELAQKLKKAAKALNSSGLFQAVRPGYERRTADNAVVFYSHVVLNATEEYEALVPIYWERTKNVVYRLEGALDKVVPLGSLQKVKVTRQAVSPA